MGNPLWVQETTGAYVELVGGKNVPLLSFTRPVICVFVFQTDSYSFQVWKMRIEEPNVQFSWVEKIVSKRKMAEAGERSFFSFLFFPLCHLMSIDLWIIRFNDPFDCHWCTLFHLSTYRIYLIVKSSFAFTYHQSMSFPRKIGDEGGVKLIASQRPAQTRRWKGLQKTERITDIETLFRDYNLHKTKTKGNERMWKRTPISGNIGRDNRKHLEGTRASKKTCKVYNLLYLVFLLFWETIYIKYYRITIMKYIY